MIRRVTSLLSPSKNMQFCNEKIRTQPLFSLPCVIIPYGSTRTCRRKNRVGYPPLCALSLESGDLWSGAPRLTRATNSFPVLKTVFHPVCFQRFSSYINIAGVERKKLTLCKIPPITGRVILPVIEFIACLVNRTVYISYGIRCPVKRWGFACFAFSWSWRTWLSEKKPTPLIKVWE